MHILYICIYVYRLLVKLERFFPWSWRVWPSLYTGVVQQTARQTNREACHEHPVSSSIIKRQPSCPTGREVSANFHPGEEGGAGGGGGGGREGWMGRGFNLTAI